jgi:anti-anti-sigma regulatory factor
MQIEIVKTAEALKITLPDLITRGVGKRMYEAIVKKTSNIHDDEVLVFDFHGISVIDSSFIDEFLVKIIETSRNSEKKFFVKIKNISPSAEINIDVVFKSYSHYHEKRIGVITDSICQNNSFCIGPLSANERDILNFVRINKSAGISDLMSCTGREKRDLEKDIQFLSEARLLRMTNDNICWSL